MPYPGTMNNPSGINGQEGIEEPYGAVTRLAQQTAAVPLPANRAISAPRRAQRAAQRPTAAPVAAPPGMPQSGAVSVDAPQDYPTQLAQVWAQLAAEPNASPLVKSLAEQAQGGNPVATG